MVSNDKQLLLDIYNMVSETSFIMMINDKIGKQVDNLINKTSYSDKISEAVNKALEKALFAALYTIDLKSSSNLNAPVANTFISSSLGFASGFFGLAGLAVELPITTTLMLRSIACIAKDCGEDLESLESRLNCIGVLGLVSGKTEQEDFFLSRKDMNKSVEETLGYIGANITGKVGIPLLSKAMSVVFNRFGLTVTEKISAQSIPLIGAIGGAALNAIFMDYYQNMAYAHFSLRMLERKYGISIIEKELADIKKSNVSPDIIKIETEKKKTVAKRLDKASISKKTPAKTVNKTERKNSKKTSAKQKKAD